MCAYVNDGELVGLMVTRSIPGRAAGYLYWALEIMAVVEREEEEKMPRSKKATPGIPIVAEALNLLTVDELKKRVALLPTAERPTRKAALVALLEQHLDGERLQALWERLDEVQQKAVSETLYAADGVFHAEKFAAKYGRMPHFGTQEGSWSHNTTPTLLRVFLYSPQRYSTVVSIVPDDLKQRLLRFVPAPVAPSLPALEELPECYAQEEQHYAYDDDDNGPLLISRSQVFKLHKKPPKVTVTVQQLPLTRCATEHAAQQDVQTVLRLIDRGKIAVSDKTLYASSATMAELASLLRGGDFYALQPQHDKWEQVIGPIKAFAWPLLVQAAKLAELHGKKLALTTAGRRALSAPPADTLRLLWQRWLTTKLLDEFNRVDVIKGQRGRGKQSMTAVTGRRTAIAAALQHCPIGKWVQFDDFSNFMQAASFDFAVTREPWDLYIADANYGSLGYDGYHGWSILQARYALCLLFEYAATLGMLDVAYLSPAGVRRDYQHMWGTDDLVFLSRYDGLLYFRLNPLGAYCLGVTRTYVPSRLQARASLTVLPSLQVTVHGSALAPEEALFLEIYADQETETGWRLNRAKALAAVESGHQIAELRAFLAARDDQPLPETVEGFIVTLEQRARALVNTGTALLIACADADLADLIATHALTHQLCMRAGERHLVVQVDAEDQFRQALHALGYGMPRV
jgi:uncharacterized small protein (DUF1192 family)